MVRQRHPFATARLINHDTLAQKALLGVFLAMFGATGTLFEISTWAEVVKCTELQVKTKPQQYSSDGVVGQAYDLLNFFYSA